MTAGAGRMSRRGTFESFRNASYRRYWAGLLVCQTGNWARMVGLTLLVLERTGDGLAVGLLSACQYAPILLLGAWSGLLADRSDKRRLLIRVQALGVVTSSALVAFSSMDDAPLALLYVIALASGVTSALDQPARRSFVVEIVPPDLVANAASLNTAGITSSQVMGPAVAGFVVATFGYTWCFALDAFSYIPFLVALLSISPSTLHRPPVTTRAAKQIREGIRHVQDVPALRIALTMMAIVGTLAFNFQVIVPLLVTRSLGGSDTDFAFVFAVLSLGSLCGALFVARYHAIELPLVVGTCAMFGVAMLAMAAAPTLTVALGAAFLLGVASMGYWACVNAFIQLRVSGSFRGRVMALQGVVSFGGAPLGGPLLGAASDVFGGRAGFVTGGCACFVAAIWASAADRGVTARASRVAPAAEVRSPADEWR